jgi:hypothetical protein
VGALHPSKNNKNNLTNIKKYDKIVLSRKEEKVLKIKYFSKSS